MVSEANVTEELEGLERTLHSVFKLKSFRGKQKQAIASVAIYRQDTLVVMPTGAPTVGTTRRGSQPDPCIHTPPPVGI